MYLWTFSSTVLLDKVEERGLSRWNTNHHTRLGENQSLISKSYVNPMQSPITDLCQDADKQILPARIVASSPAPRSSPEQHYA